MDIFDGFIDRESENGLDGREGETFYSILYCRGHSVEEILITGNI